MNQSAQYVGSSQRWTAATIVPLRSGPENSLKGTDSLSVDRTSEGAPGHQRDIKGKKRKYTKEME